MRPARAPCLALFGQAIPLSSGARGRGACINGLYRQVFSASCGCRTNGWGDGIQAMPDAIARQARRTPGKLALRHTTGDLSYADLAGRISSVRSFLAGQTLDPKALAAVCVFNLLDAWVIGAALRRLGL